MSDKKPGDLVISVITFRAPVNIGGYGVEDWSLENASTSQLHGRVRVEEAPPIGLKICYAAGDVYQEHTVPWSNIADICRVPRSQLKPTTIAFLDSAGRRGTAREAVA